MSINFTDIHRGEIWLINFDPSLGDEIQKKRPAVVLSSDSIGVLKIKLVAPITGWNSNFQNKVWITKLAADSRTNLSKESSVDVLQVRSVSVERFINKIGLVPADKLEEIIAALAIIVEYQ